MKNLYDPVTQPYIFFRNTAKVEKSLPFTCYHRHNAFEIYLFLSGSRKVCVENAAYLCRPGDLFIICPETFHAGICEEACEYDRIIMNIRPEFIEEICKKGAQVGACFDFDRKTPIRRTHLSCQERETVMELFEKYAQAQKDSEYGGRFLATPICCSF